MRKSNDQTLFIQHSADLATKIGQAPELEHEAKPEFVVYAKDGESLNLLMQ